MGDNPEANHHLMVIRDVIKLPIVLPHVHVPEHIRWIVAVDLPGAPRIEQQCAQRIPRLGLCQNRVDFVCDQCAKPVCRSHIYYAALPRQVDRDPAAARAAGEYYNWPRNLHTGERLPHAIRPRSAPTLDLCATCRALERHYRIAIEEVSDEQREQFHLIEPGYR